MTSKGLLILFDALVFLNLVGLAATIFLCWIIYKDNLYLISKASKD